MHDSTPWLANRRPNPSTLTRLYCFPHSGGSAGEYLRWSDRLSTVEVWVVQYPGRGARLDEQPLHDLVSLIGQLTDEVDFTGRFGFFGHSLGALVAFETAHALRELGRVTPQWLFASGYPAPHLTVLQDRTPLHKAPDVELVARLVADFGESAAHLHEDPDLLALLLSCNRADYQIVETYRYRDRPLIGSPLHVVGGLDDEIPINELTDWRRHAAADFAVHLLPGDHFYFRRCPQLLFDLLSASAGQTWQPIPTSAKGSP